MPESPFELLRRHFDVSHETLSRLSTYHTLLLKWQTHINLVGPDTIHDAWSRHFLDSLQLLAHLPDRQAIIVDLGSGAGFPGLVISCCNYSQVHLIESDTRKATFMREVARATQSPAHIVHKRIESVSLEHVRYITSRACAPLDKLLAMASRFVSHETTCLFHKGKNYSKDIEEARKAWDFDIAIFPSISQADGVILKIEHLRGKRDEQHNSS